MVNHKGRTPLHLAAVYGHQQVVELLTEQRQQDIGAKDEVRDGGVYIYNTCHMHQSVNSSHLLT